MAERNRQRTPQPRAVQTRAVILRAAAEVFDEYGFSGASISKIMKRAGVTQGGMYFHFGSKEELAYSVMVSQGEGLDFPKGEDGLQRLIDITLYLAVELRRNPLLRAGVRLAVEQGEFGLRDDVAYQAWVLEFRQQLRFARARGELLPGLDDEDFAWVLVSSFTGAQLFSQVSSERRDLPQRVVSLWRYLLPAVAVPAVRDSLRFDLPEGGGEPEGAEAEAEVKAEVKAEADDGVGVGG